MSLKLAPQLIVTWRPSRRLATLGRVSEGSQLAGVLRERSSECVAAWIVWFERSAFRCRRTTKAATHTAQVASLVEALTDAATGGGPLQPGSGATPEAQRSCELCR